MLFSRRNVDSSVVSRQVFAPHASSTDTAFATAGLAVVAHATTTAAVTSAVLLTPRVRISYTYPAGMAKHHGGADAVLRRLGVGVHEPSRDGEGVGECADSGDVRQVRADRRQGAGVGGGEAAEDPRRAHEPRRR